MNNGQNDNFESVHLLRGIAAMLVLMAHSFQSFYLVCLVAEIPKINNY
jgi:peptidoglycan/LPS O-acetylase OafA/YrhL